MSEVITTLHKKGDNTVDVYPNIKSDNIPNDAVTEDKILNGSVTTNKIADDSITEDKILDGAVTTDKIADSSVTFNKLGFNLYFTSFMMVFDNYAVTLSFTTKTLIDSTNIADFIKYIFDDVNRVNMFVVCTAVGTIEYKTGRLATLILPPNLKGIALYDDLDNEMAYINLDDITSANFGNIVSKPIY